MRRFLPCALLLAASGAALGQQPPLEEQLPRQDQQPREGLTREGVRRSFDSSAPKLGQPLPDVRGYLSDGSEFPLSNLKGQYSVVVFGCLT
jgi:cytochrome oxidase Cu insertion factor (SCO1/SenC/PrrC family)